MTRTAIELARWLGRQGRTPESRIRAWYAERGLTRSEMARDIGSLLAAGHVEWSRGEYRSVRPRRIREALLRALAHDPEREWTTRELADAIGEDVRETGHALSALSLRAEIDEWYAEGLRRYRARRLVIR